VSAYVVNIAEWFVRKGSRELLCVYMGDGEERDFSRVNTTHTF